MTMRYINRRFTYLLTYLQTCINLKQQKLLIQLLSISSNINQKVLTNRSQLSAHNTKFKDQMQRSFIC